jgi:Tfp pilus assembly protein PilN
MKEIDFLPEWYKSGRRRQVNYRTQYIILGGIFLVMMVWNFITSYSISKAEARVVQMTDKQARAEKVSAKLAELKNEMNTYHKRETLVERIDSKINIANILAEISYLIDERIVLGKIELVSEKFVDIQNKDSSRQAVGVVRAVQSDFAARGELPIGGVRFKVIIAGVAADASDVAALICKLENSPYFCQVILSYSRNTDIEVQSSDVLSLRKEHAQEMSNISGEDRKSDGNIRVSNFEINCYLANYREQ